MAISSSPSPFGESAFLAHCTLLKLQTAKEKLIDVFYFLNSAKELLPKDKKGTVLSAGQHPFPFVFNITPSAAVAERCNYGRVSQRVQASGKGLGRANSDISSDYRYLAFVANPQPDVGQCAL